MTYMAAFTHSHTHTRDIRGKSILLMVLTVINASLVWLR